MTITYSLTEADITAWQEHSSLQPKLNLWWILSAAVLGVAIGIWHTPAFFFWVAVGALVLALQAGEKVPSEVLGVRSVSLESEGLRIHSPRYRRLIFWEACQPVQETETHLFLTFAPRGVIIIPRRIFASPEAWSQFRHELIHRNVWSLPQAA